MSIKRIQTLIADSSKVRICEGPLVDELESMSAQFDRLVVKSALAIKDQRKILVTTGSELMEKLGTLGNTG